MRIFIGHKTLTESTKGESRKLGAKCMYASLTPNPAVSCFSPGSWVLNTGFRLLLFVLFLLATLVPVEFPIDKVSGNSPLLKGVQGVVSLLQQGFGVTDAFAADSGYLTATGSMIIARGWHTSTLLQNGKVLITGGDVGGGGTAKAGFIVEAGIMNM